VIESPFEMAGIDLHTHLAPRGSAGAPRAAAHGSPSGVAGTGDGSRSAAHGSPSGVAGTGDGSRSAAHGSPSGAAGTGDLHDPDRLVASLDVRGLDTAVVSVPPPFYPAPDAASVRAANDGLRAAVAGRSRLSTLAYLPLESVELAVAEVGRALADGHVGFTASAGGRSPSLADPELEPLWAALDERGAMLMLHPGASPDVRMEELYLLNLLGNPVETTLAAAQLVFGDVLARFPRMRIVLVHGGGAVAALAGRWERGVDTNRPDLRPLTEPPLTAIRRLYVDTVTHDPGLTTLAIERFGADRLVLGSDWPFPMGAYDHAGLPEAVATTNVRAALGSPRPA
jgi:aminocarboxymuconate-semialdehyde decarboxylase